MHRWTLAFLLGCGCALAQETGPITSFEIADHPLIASGATLERVQEYATDGEWALKATIPGSANDSWPGILFRADQPDWSGRELFSLDIFLAGDQPQTLSFRLDDAAGHKVFGSQRLNPGWNKGWAVGIKAAGAEADLTQITQLLLYRRIPRDDAVLYLDNVRWTTFEGKFNRIVHHDPATPRAPTRTELRQGFQLFTRHPLAMVFGDSVPDQPLSEPALITARGELEPMTLSVHALRAQEAVKLSVSDLLGPGGARIPADRWDLRRVINLDKRIHYKSDDYVAGMPTYAAPLTGPVPIPAGQTQRFWLTLAAPADAAPGVYRGSVLVHSGETITGTTLRVRVLPFALPELPDLLYGEYYRLFGRLTETEADIRRDLADMRRHAMTSVGLCFGVETGSFTVDGEQVTFRFNGDTPFEWFMNAYRDLGFPAPIVLLSDSGQAAAASVGALGEPAYDRVYVNFHQALAAEAAQRGWPKIYVQPVDEPGWQTEEHRERNVHLLKLLHAAGIPTEQDGPGDDYFHTAAGPYSDIWNYNGAIGTPEVVERALADGHLITIYNNDVESYRPEVDRWAYGLFNWRNRMQGGFNWEYRGGYGDLYNNLDADTGDWVHDYPATDEHPGGPSLAWEMSREGVEDRQYLELLERTIAEGRAAGGAAQVAADQAAARLDDLRARLSDSRYVRGQAAWEALLSAEQARAAGLEVPEGAVKVAIGQMKQPNGLALPEYDTIRWMVAAETVRILATLGRTEPLAAVEPTAEAPASRLEAIVRDRGETLAAPRPTALVPELAAAPTIDGALDEPAWAEAAEVSLARSDGSGPTEQPTEVRFGLHQGTFYVGFVAHEDRIEQMVAQVRDLDGPVWEDDVVEVFLDPGPTEKTWHQVLVNSLGTVARAGTASATWKPDVAAATQVQRDRNRWLAELAIPVGDLKLAPRFGLNFGRERRPTEVMELSTWSSTGGGFGRPERFGLAVIEGDVPAAAAIEPTLKLAVSPGWMRVDEPRLDLRFDLTLPPDQWARASLALSLTGAGRTIEAVVPAPLSERVTAKLNLGDLPAGDYELIARLLGPQPAPLIATAKMTRVAGPFAN